MKFVTTVLATLLFVLNAQASQVSCFTKYFNGMEIPVLLKATSSSDHSLRNVSLSLDHEIERAAKVIKGYAYNGRKYKNMVSFVLEGPGVKKGNGYEGTGFTLLLPIGFSAFVNGAKFDGVLLERASDGGSSNGVLCRLVR